MKRTFLAALAAMLTLGTVSAQNNMTPFSHLGIGFEVGLQGGGVELSMPLTNRLVVKAGLNWFPAMTVYSQEFKINTQDLKASQTYFDGLNGGPAFQHYFGAESKVNADASLGLKNWKFMLNFYPRTDGKFYVAAGVYTGEENLVQLSGNTNENDWAALKELNDLNKQYNLSTQELEVSINGQKFPISEKDGCGYMEADYRIAKVKPYLGIGFGRAIPDKRVGFQFEVGAWYHGQGTLYCQDQLIPEGDDLKDITQYTDKLKFYPQLTLRLTGLLF